MSRNLGSRCRTIRSPWPDYAVYSFPDASVVGESDRPSLMDAMNGIIAVNWKATEPHWTAASSPFDGKYGLILVFDMSGLIAFSAYRVLNVAGTLAIYRSGTEVLPAHQGRGLYRLLHLRGPENFGQLQIRRQWRALRMANAQPDRVGGQCQDLRKGRRRPCSATRRTPRCRPPVSRCASSLYPGKALEVPDMIMRGAYGHIRHHRQDYHGMASLVDAAMSRIIPDSADALFSVGYARV